MTNKEKRIAIAEACGFTNAMHKIKNYPTWEHRDGRRCTFVQLPNYLNDLNAMHAAEKYLTGPQQYQYIGILGTITGEVRSRVMATSQQRANAFLKTLGLYTDEI